MLVIEVVWVVVHYDIASFHKLFLVLRHFLLAHRTLPEEVHVEVHLIVRFVGLKPCSTSYLLREHLHCVRLAEALKGLPERYLHSVVVLVGCMFLVVVCVLKRSVWVDQTPEEASVVVLVAEDEIVNIGETQLVLQ